MLRLRGELSPNYISITPYGIGKGRDSIVIEIDKFLFVQIWTDLDSLLFNESINASAARYFYIKNEDLGIFFGVDRLAKGNGKFSYIRLEYYLDIELKDETQKIIYGNNNSELIRNSKYAKEIIQGEIDIVEMLQTAFEEYEDIITSRINPRDNVVDANVNVEKLTNSKLKYSGNKSVAITEDDRKKFKNDTEDIPIGNNDNRRPRRV